MKQKFSDVYDVKKIILFIIMILAIIALFVIGIIFVIGHFNKTRVEVTENTNETATVTDALPEEKRIDSEKCYNKISLKLHADLSEYVENCYGIEVQNDYGGFFITAEVKDEKGLVEYCNSKFGEETSVDSISLPKYNNSLINMMNTQNAIHRWFIYGDPIPGTKGFETHELIMTEDSGKQYIYIVI